MGVINPMGHDVETMWAELKNGRSGVGYTTIFDATHFPTKISAEIKNWDVTDIGEDAEEWKNRGRHSRFAAGAARQAIDSSGVLDSIEDPTRFGVYLGSGEGNQDFVSFTRIMAAALNGGEGLDIGLFTKVGLETLNPVHELEQQQQW